MNYNRVSQFPRERARYSVANDLSLLRMVLDEDPFSDHRKWAAIGEALKRTTGKNFSARSVRERTDHVVKAFIRSGGANKRRLAGLDASSLERETLLEKVAELKGDYIKCLREPCSGGGGRVLPEFIPVEITEGPTKPEKMIKMEARDPIGISRESAEDGLNSTFCDFDSYDDHLGDSATEFPQDQPQTETSCREHMNSRLEKKLAYKREKLEYKKRKLDLDTARFEEEREDRRLFRELLTKQLSLIDVLLNKN